MKETQMASNWHYAKGTQQSGPITLEEILSLLASGHLSPSNKVWREGMSDWVEAKSVPELSAGFNDAEQSPLLPPSIGVESIGFAPRAKAFLLDVMIMILPAVIVGEIITGVLSLLFGSDSTFVRRADTAVGYGFWPMYFGAFEGSAWQASIGKRLLGLRVIEENGQPSSVNTAMWRYLSLALTCGLGALPVLWSPDHLGLHDKWSRTRVVRDTRRAA
jgi:uncharacterized RDD family membrane protein YckC